MPIPHDFEFLGLSAEERAVLAYRLLEGMVHEIACRPLPPAELAEIERRVTEAGAGRIVTSTCEDARRRLRKRAW